MLIYCDSGSPRHGKRHPRPAVQGFWFDEHSRDGLTCGWIDQNRSRRLVAEAAHVDALVRLIGDELPREATADGPERWSGDLECKKCGEKVDVRGERLFPALTRLADMGRDRISIQDIRRGIGA